MNKLFELSFQIRPLAWGALLAGMLLTACGGGGDGGRDPILGEGGTAGQLPILQVTALLPESEYAELAPFMRLVGVEAAGNRFLLQL